MQCISEPLTVPVRVKVAVLIPITRAEESSSGPPELPALMAASVCRAPPAQLSHAGIWSHLCYTTAKSVMSFATVTSNCISDRMHVAG